MASKPAENLCNFDWDDTALINAYNEGLKEREMLKKGKKSSSNKENVEGNHPKWWKPGDHCQALWSADNQYYEAKVTHVDRDRCTVEFVGYGDRETVYAKFLKQSAGKKARRRQRKEALSGDASESGVTTTDCEEETQRWEETNENAPPPQASYNYAASEAYQYPPPSTHMPHPPAVPLPVPSFGHHHGNSCFTGPAPQPSQAPVFRNPPALPIPHCPNMANNPSLTSMLVAWYMAGYYTGLHQQKDSQCNQRCCGHANRCCH